MIATREDNLMRAVVLFIILSILAAMMMMFAGCTVKPSWWPTTPKQDLLAARSSYGAAAKIITLYRMAGSFNTDEGKIIDDMADSLMEMLARWEAAIELGQSTSDVAKAFNEILLEFVTKQMQGKDRYEKKGAQP